MHQRISASRKVPRISVIKFSSTEWQNHWCIKILLTVMTLYKCFLWWNAQRTFTTSPTLNFPSYPWVNPFSSSVLVSDSSFTSSSSKSNTVILESYLREHFASFASSCLLTLPQFRVLKGVPMLLDTGAKNELTVAVNDRKSAAERSINRQARNIMTAVYNKYRTCVSTAQLLRLWRKSLEKYAAMKKVCLNILSLPSCNYSSTYLVG